LTAALFWDSWLNNDATVNASVSNRVAYLSGAVDSSFQKAEAQDVASRTKGVLSVHNQVKVEPEYPIYDYSYYPDYDYGYYGGFGSYGWPYYYSQWPYYGYDAFAVSPYLSDEQIKQNIEDKFYWSPFVDSDDINVAVDGGVATLTGTVGTWIGWGEADRDARKSGATSVLNRVTVKKGAWSWSW
jgi:osmotically-inducible protein OsmY